MFKECNFRKSKLVINADDAIFENCCFIDAKFGIITYGYEYGGRRTKFYNCDFTGAEFKNVEFRASKFYNCNFTRTRFISCDLRGIKFEGNEPKIEQYERMKIPEMIPE
ncbi:pentapeptide repeat-containing protein [Parabacteroides merdae]|uniref:Pentapeptide repeat-containing protein n=1 Tax=Parabacteroides merdae TaxID=46503 RepID=A0ABW9SGM1_9BACT|nr:pentapeptide repeat-containing protein [Parabacteroides merdae]